MTPIITIPGDKLISTLDRRGWTQGGYGTHDPVGPVCAHGAIRLCAPVPGDAALIEQVAARQGWGTWWNDDKGTTEADVRALLAAGVEVTDAELADTFGPQWRAVVNMVRRAAVLTDDEASRLFLAWPATRSPVTKASDAALNAFTGATAVSQAAKVAAMEAGLSATQEIGRSSVHGSVIETVRVAVWAILTWDLATPDGPYTFEHRDLLIGPWRSVCGLPDGLIENGVNA